MDRRSLIRAAAVGAASPALLLGGCGGDAVPVAERREAFVQDRVRADLAGTFAAERMFPDREAVPFWTCATLVGDGTGSLGCLDAMLVFQALAGAGIQRTRANGTIVDHAPVVLPEAFLVGSASVAADIPSMRLLFQQPAHREAFSRLMADTPVIFSHQGSCAFASAHLGRNHIAAAQFPVGRLTTYLSSEGRPDNHVVTLNLRARGGEENWRSPCLAHSERNYLAILRQVQAAIENPSVDPAYTRADREHLRRLDESAFYSELTGAAKAAKIAEWRDRVLAPLACVTD